MTLANLGIAGVLVAANSSALPPYLAEDFCYAVNDSQKSCAERLTASGWHKEHELPALTMDAGTNYEVWRNAKKAMLCSLHWARGSETTMSCRVMQPVSSKN